MLNWEPGPTGGLVAVTPFCRMSIWSIGSNKRYLAAIDGRFRNRLACIEDLPSEDAARAWCEGAYRELLSAELARLG